MDGPTFARDMANAFRLMLVLVGAAGVIVGLIFGWALS